MAKQGESESFGMMVRKLRMSKGWTVKEFIERLSRAGQRVSPAYITRIEQYNEIPAPALILRIADVFDIDAPDLFRLASMTKTMKLIENLERKYREAEGLYRDRQDRKRSTD